MIRVAIIGCGGVSRGHVRGYEAIDGVQVTALADTNASKAGAFQEELSQRHPVQAYEDYRELLAKESLNAVSVCTPHYLHYEQALGALEGGLHALVEKPLTTDPDKDVELVRAATRNGCKLAVRYQRHSLAPYREAKKLVAKGQIGRIETMVGRLGQSWYRNQFKRIERDGDSWRMDPKRSGGGQIVDSGSHLIDAMFWVSGHTPATVYAQTINKDFEVDVCSALIVSTDQGALATICIDGDTPVGVGYSSLEFCGDEGYLKVTNDAVELGRQGEEMQEVALPASSDSIRDFVDAILNDRPVVASGEDGLVADLVARAALRSACTGKPEACHLPQI